LKKLYTMLLVIFITVLLAACQSTPDKPVVIQKDMEQMIEKAQATTTAEETPGITIKDHVGAPDTFVYENSEEDFTVSADAPVFVPDADSMPIINVRSAVFSQETVDKYWDVLVGDQAMWDWSDQPTKGDLEQMIINQRRMTAEAEKEGHNTQGYEDIITDLEKLYQSAPETSDVTPATSQLKEKINWDPVLGTIDTRYEGTSGSSVKSQAELENSNEWIYFSARNPWTGEEGSIKSDTLPATMRFEAPAIKNGYSNQVDIDENTELDTTVSALLKMTPKEAKQKVETFLNETDTPMKVYSMKLLSDADKVAGKQAQHYAYEFNCVRTLENGLTVSAPAYGSASNYMPPGYVPKSSEPAYSSNWTYENLIFQLDDEGFFQICWQAPIDILDTEVEDCKILPFDDIKAVFEKMIFVSYEPNFQDGYSMTCDISQIRLEMMRVRKQNTDPNALDGLLIPVWVFYGEISLYSDEGEKAGGLLEGSSILAINAVDGSLIDSRKGY